MRLMLLANEDQEHDGKCQIALTLHSISMVELGLLTVVNSIPCLPRALELSSTA